LIRRPDPVASKLSATKILKRIGCPHLRLYRGEGYWYFIYDAPGRYDSHSVYEMHLGGPEHMDFWVAEGRELVTKMEQAAA
jgi:hypothetical protein